MCSRGVPLSLTFCGLACGGQLLAVLQLGMRRLTASFCAVSICMQTIPHRRHILSSVCIVLLHTLVSKRLPALSRFKGPMCACREACQQVHMPSGAPRVSNLLQFHLQPLVGAYPSGLSQICSHHGPFMSFMCFVLHMSASHTQFVALLVAP